MSPLFAKWSSVRWNGPAFILWKQSTPVRHTTCCRACCPILCCWTGCSRAPADWISPVVFDDIQYQERAYDKWAAYGQSKTANIWFSMELNKRLAESGITANAVRPGGIITDLGRHLSAEIRETMTKQIQESGIQLKSVPAGAATSVWAATADEFAHRGGLYLEDCHIAEPSEEGGSSGYASHAYDEAGAAKLWSLSENLLGRTF